MFGYHFKGDTRVMFHTKHADLIDPGNIVVRGDDTDIIVVLSWNVEKLQKTGTYNSSRKYIDVTELAKNMKNIKALPGIYAFTRNDYTPAFFKKEKIRPIQLMQKNKKFVGVFTNPGDFTLNTDTFDVLEEFTCYLLGHLKQNDLHDVIKLHFEEKTKHNCIQKHLEILN